MENPTAIALLITALIVPIGLFWWLRARFRASGVLAAAVAVVVGWALNIAWAFASQAGATDGENVSIALRFGWACPTALVLLTWLVWRFRKGRA